MGHIRSLQQILSITIIFIYSPYFRCQISAHLTGLKKAVNSHALFFLSSKAMTNMFHLVRFNKIGMYF